MGNKRSAAARRNDKALALTRRQQKRTPQQRSGPPQRQTARPALKATPAAAHGAASQRPPAKAQTLADVAVQPAAAAVAKAAAQKSTPAARQPQAVPPANAPDGAAAPETRAAASPRAELAALAIPAAEALAAPASPAAVDADSVSASRATLAEPSQAASPAAPTAGDVSESQTTATADLQPKRAPKYHTLARMATMAPGASAAVAPTPRATREPDGAVAQIPEAAATASATNASAARHFTTTPHLERVAPNRPLGPRTRNLPAASAALPRRRATDPRLRTFGGSNARRPQPLPELKMVVPVASVHACVAVVSALIGAALVLAGNTLALWPLALSAILGLGAWIAFGIGQHERTERLAGVVLLSSQEGALAWAFALLGARATLLVPIAALAVLAARTAGRVSAVLGAAAALALYATAPMLVSWFAFAGTPQFDRTLLAVVDGVLLVGGILLLLGLTLDMDTRRARAEAVTQARMHEARQLRARLSYLRQHVEDDGEQLQVALTHALFGQGVEIPEVEGLLSPLAETVAIVGERLATLQRDREDRLRLEGAVQQLTRALERAKLGLPWSWPEPSGTPLDALRPLLPTPLAPIALTPMRRDDTPATLVPMPALAPMPRAGLWGPWDTSSMPAALRELRATVRPISRDVFPSNVTSLGSSIAWPTHSAGSSLWSERPVVRWPTRAADSDASLPAAPVAPALPAYPAPLPWHDWDTWATWDAMDED